MPTMFRSSNRGALPKINLLEAKHWRIRKDFKECGGFSGEGGLAMLPWAPNLISRNSRKPSSLVLGLNVYFASREINACNYDEETTGKISKLLAPYYVPGLETIIYALEPTIGHYADKTCEKFVADNKNPLSLYEIFLTRTWISAYPNCVRSGESPAALRETVEMCLSDIWNVVCLYEGRATISRDTFEEFVPIMMEFAEEFYGYYGEEDMAWRMHEFSSDPTLALSPYGASCDRWRAVNKCSYEEYVKRRILDFRDFFNTHALTIPVQSCIEKFMRSSFASLAIQLIKDNRLICCQNVKCKRLAAYYPRKKHCSFDVDGRDCRQRSYQQRRYRKASRKSASRVHLKASRKIKAF